jgi:hypothetical protein
MKKNHFLFQEDGSHIFHNSPGDPIVIRELQKITSYKSYIGGVKRLEVRPVACNEAGPGAYDDSGFSCFGR